METMQRDSRGPMAIWMYGNEGHRGNTTAGAPGYNPPSYSARRPDMDSYGGGDRYRPDMMGPDFGRNYFSPSTGPPPNVRPGDWLCPAGCRISNFRSRTACFKCKTPKPENPELSLPPTPIPPPQHEVRPHDWECVDCNFSNYESRESCFKCNKVKPSDAPLTSSLQNWECCDSCFASNHFKRYECFKCLQKKPADAKPATKLEDWFCPSCAWRNAARRTNCAQCDGARPGRERELEKNPDWKCGGCGIMNWSWRRECYKCQEEKEDADTKQEVKEEN